MATEKEEIKYTDELMSQINPKILTTTATDASAVQSGYDLPGRIWIQVTDKFVSNCNDAICEPVNIEYYMKEFGVDDESKLLDWYGFMYSAYPKAIIEVMCGPDGSNVIDISQVEMMKINEAFENSHSPEERRDLVDMIIHVYMIW